MCLRLRLRPGPGWRSLQLSPGPLLGFKGLLRGRGGREGKGRREGNEGEGERKGTWRGERDGRRKEEREGREGGPPTSKLVAPIISRASVSLSVCLSDDNFRKP